MDPAKAIDATEFVNLRGLRLTLSEAENILRALRDGEIDGVMVGGAGGERVYMLSGAEHPYRVMIETMSEGAVTLTANGTITYFNKRFAEMVCTSRDLKGTAITHLVTDVQKLESLISKAETINAQDEIALKTDDGTTVSTLFSISPLELDDETTGLCIVVTDLTEQKHNQELKASRELEHNLLQQAEASQRNISNILESITDSYIALDGHWVITAVNERAAIIFGKSREQLIGNIVWDMFPLTAEREFYDQFHRAVAKQRPAHFEARSRTTPGSWFEVHAYPSDGGLSVYLRDITERKLVEEERERLLYESREANRQKDEFLAMLSHELRNPLAPITNALEVLRRCGADEPQLVSSRDVIDRQVHVLGRLIDDLLDASRITSGKVRIQTEAIEFANVVSRAVETARPLIDARKHRLMLSLPSEPVWLRADPTRIAQVLNNLLNNAAKFTEEGGDVALTAKREGNELVISVRDTGVGIPTETLPHIFDLFTQADRSLDRSQGGLGIGLTLARSIVGMHGGTLQAFSAGPNEGSEFVVRLPVVDEPAQRLGARVSVESATAVRSRRILVVDDNVDSAESMAVLMKLSGHQIAIAFDGESALKTAGTFRPQIIILDVGLPRIHGYEVAERLRALPENRNLVLVALTGYGREQDRRRAIEAGFDYHFVKPIDFTTLELLVNSLPEP